MNTITKSERKRNEKISPERRAELEANARRGFTAFTQKFGLPSRALGKDDFNRICRAEGINLARDLDHPAAKSFYKRIPEIKGFVWQTKNRDFTFLYLRCFFQGKFDSFTAFHELGHYFLGHCDLSFKTTESRIAGESEREFEADYFALLAIKKAEVSK